MLIFITILINENINVDGKTSFMWHWTPAHRAVVFFCVLNYLIYTSMAKNMSTFCSHSARTVDYLKTNRTWVFLKNVFTCICVCPCATNIIRWKMQIIANMIWPSIEYIIWYTMRYNNVKYQYNIEYFGRNNKPYKISKYYYNTRHDNS